ncbi:T9SS type A sorting domain-containing protein [Flavobacterium sp.]|uniref:T9SS type A sorting domain-containing protein n=1 Tax=Flavobacterium sp. TaxID=239 RepID=UPI0011FC87A4|nr:T9SS type A sorting domain-containing protein [Flavobacterium sp.]RZJ71826.1 MAG: T9SS type A sorting domain-containing protein [Flavobacterium sp.]
MRKFLLLFFIGWQACFSQTWNASENLCPTYTNAFFFDLQNGFVYGDGYINSTNDSGVTWTKQSFTNASSIGLQVEKLDDNTAIVFGKNGNYCRTTDKGASWTLSTLGFSGNEDVYSVSFSDALNGFVSGKLNPPNNPFLAKTVDGGLTWTIVSPNIPIAYSFGVKYLTPSVGFMLHDIFKRTTDGGISWTNVTSGISGTISRIEIAENGTLCAYGSEKIYRSSDNGITWTLLSDLTPSNNIYLNSERFAIRSNHLLTTAITNTNQRIFVDYDLTTGAMEITPNTLDGYLGVYNTDTENAIAVKYSISFSGLEILRSSNGGSTWQIIRSSFTGSGSHNLLTFEANPNNLVFGAVDGNLTKFSVVASDSNGTSWQTKLSVPAYNGKLLRAHDNYIAAIIQELSAFSFSYKESFDAGNTWNSYTVNDINFTSPMHSDLSDLLTKVRIYDINAHLIYQTSITASNNQISGLSSVSRGTYFLVVGESGNQKISKIIKK